MPKNSRSEARVESDTAEGGRTITSIDLFAGAGKVKSRVSPSDLGYLPVYAVEHELAAAKTFSGTSDAKCSLATLKRAPTTRRPT